MPHLALYTFGVLKTPLADPAPLTREFHERGAAIYEKFSQHPGYLARAEPKAGDQGSHFELDWGVWGEFAVPTWYDKGHAVDTTAFAASLSLWTDLHSAFDAIYTGLHRAALNRRYDWFERSARPGYVFWWVSDGETPTWGDGVSKLEHLHDHGSAPHAFSFRDAFTPEGTPSKGYSKGSGVGLRSDHAH
ncbi:DUF3291 domain-containing protein [Streptomyces sp. NBC_00083]|uniref:DUF3291 domain-containing protein n=1 Tax=Streptomyces sp. NBC_00083 TaxID=2975647 RepID=UPI002253FC50|nr:DUF3291 domain-containing protein [Streptomyces sp. NBC_00083]MCX5384602.1 DUF3291 domain-containing protein [Streptomyces sp. NBC_00083]